MLEASPFLLVSNDPVNAKLTATNAIGESSESTYGDGAFIPEPPPIPVTAETLDDFGIGATEALAAFAVAVAPSAYLVSKNPEIINVLTEIYNPYSGGEES